MLRDAVIHRMSSVTVYNLANGNRSERQEENLPATGYGLRATGYGLRVTGYGQNKKAAHFAPTLKKPLHSRDRS